MARQVGVVRAGDVGVLPGGAERGVRADGRVARVGRCAVPRGRPQRARAVRRARALRAPLPLPLARGAHAHARAAPARGALGHRAVGRRGPRHGQEESLHHSLGLRTVCTPRVCVALGQSCVLYRLVMMIHHQLLSS